MVKRAVAKPTAVSCSPAIGSGQAEPVLVQKCDKFAKPLRTCSSLAQTVTRRQFVAKKVFWFVCAIKP